MGNRPGPAAAEAAARAERAGLGPVSLCVVNYQGERYLPETLAAACSHAPGFAEILLVDNGSRDRSLELVRSRHPQVRVLPLGRNLGPAAARNVGFRAAKHDLVLFLDNDVILEPGCLEHLRQALAVRPVAAVAMPRVLHAHAPDTVQYEGADAHFIGLMALRGAGLEARDEAPPPHAIGSVVSACFLLDRSRWRGGDPFDESFFIYLEDHDFGLRARALGCEILSVPAARCLHREGTEGLSLRETGHHTDLRVFLHIRNRWQLVLKHYERATLVRLLPLLLLYEVFQLAGATRKGWLRPWLRALRWIVRNRGEVAAKRRALQRARVRGDRELLCGGPLPFTAELARGRLERAGLRALDRLALAYGSWLGLARYTSGRPSERGGKEASSWETGTPTPPIPDRLPARPPTRRPGSSTAS